MRLLRFSVLALVLVPVLSIGMVLGASPAAYAYAAPSPVEVGKTFMKSPPGRMLTTVGSLTPWGRAAKLGLLAYTTKDAWWPVLKDTFGNVPDDDNEGQPANCQLSVATLERTGDGQGASVSLYKGPGCSSSDTDNANYTTEGTCIVLTSGVTSSFSGVTRYTTVPYGSTAGAGPVSTYNYCGTGGTLVRISVTPSKANPIKRTRSWGYPDQFVKQTTTVQCKKPDGTIVTISDSTTGVTDRVTVPSCSDRVPGSIPWSGTIAAGPNGTPPKEIVSWGTRQDVYDEYADCFGPTGLQCVIRVWVDGQPCTVDRTVCQPWRRLSEDPETKDRVQCKFGGHVIDLDDCIGITYKPEVQVKPIDKVNPDGTVDVDPEAPPKPPAPEPTPSVTPTPFPTAGPNPNPRPTDPEVVDPDSPPGGSSSCLAGAWSFNPVDWVYVPMKCAFIWAFVPKKNIGAEGSDLWGRIKGKAPFSFVAGLGSIPPITGGSCPDWRVKVGPLDQNIVCDSSYVQAVRAARPVLAGMMIVLALWPLIRGVMYASVPVIKPMPGGR